MLWSLRRLGAISSVRKLAKLGFALRYRHGHDYEIPFGPLRGMRWFMHKDHQFWMPLGAYEAETAGWLQKQLKPGMTFFDIGANAGYFTMLGSRRVGPQGRVVAFEPVPHNVATLQKQRDLNRLTNVEIAELALADKRGVAQFVLERTNANSHLSDIAISHAATQPENVFEVTVSTLDAFVAESGKKPDLLKIDVEGAELKLLQGAVETFRTVRPLAIVSTHSAQLHTDCRQFLEALGYDVPSLKGFEHELLAYPRPSV